MRFHTAVRNEFIDQTTEMLFGAYTNQLDQVPVMQTAKHLDLGQEFPPALLIISLQNLYSHPSTILKSTLIDTPKTTFTNYSRIIKFVSSSFYLN